MPMSIESSQSLIRVLPIPTCHQPGFAETSFKLVVYFTSTIVDLLPVAPVPLSAIIAHKLWVTKQRQWPCEGCTETAALVHAGESNLHAWQMYLLGKKQEEESALLSL